MAAREPSGRSKHLSAQARRYLGLELSGAKNQKTALAALEFYPRERKIFLLDIYDRIARDDGQTADEALLEVIEEVGQAQPLSRMGVNVPLELPPCIGCTARQCPMPSKCSVPAVKWMREFSRKPSRQQRSGLPIDFTPYTQRPVELWMRHQVLPTLSEHSRFEIDEALGGNKAPLTARMHFLKRQLGDVPMVEVWPKLTIALIAPELGLSRRTVSTYRQLEEGAQARTEILDRLGALHGIFIYERDLKKLAQSLPCFDAFLCSYTALLYDLGLCAKIPSGFPKTSGWVAQPVVPKSGALGRAQ